MLTKPQSATVTIILSPNPNDAQDTGCRGSDLHTPPAVRPAVTNPTRGLGGLVEPLASLGTAVEMGTPE